jgi:RND family efflux transporter MFP subunit
VNAGSGNPLFEIVALDPVRVFVQVPQSLVHGIHGGLHAVVEVNEYPGVAFAGDLTRSSGTLDPDSRTMKVELRVPNPDGKLLPGLYATVRLALETPRRAFHLPASAVLTRSGGTVVATVDAENAVRLLPVEIERDSGTEIEIRTGLTGTERVIRAPEPDVADGLSVQVSS